MSKQDRRSAAGPPEWRWEEGPVDPAREHFELSYFADPEDKWEERHQQRPPVALVGRGRGKCLLVDFPDGDRADRSARDAVEKDLTFYIVEHKDVKKWAYLIYHTDTMANVYSKVHWSYFRDERER